MAYRVEEIANAEQNSILGLIYADAKADVTDNMVLPGDVTLQEGSKAYTKALDVGIYDSNGHWNWS